MARRGGPPPKGPDWPHEKTLEVLKQQLGQLQAFKGKRFSEVDPEEQVWEQFTRSAIVHGFGEGSENTGNFNMAHWAGSHNMMGISDHQRQKNFEKRIAAYESTLRSSIRELEVMLPPPAQTGDDVVRPAAVGVVERAAGSVQTQSEDEHPLILISHSGADLDLATALVEFLQVGLMTNRIRCSSVDGYRLPAGVKTEDHLRHEVNSAEVLIGLITPNSLASHYVMFELGARWGANKFMIPLLAGVTASDIRGPLSFLNALSAHNDSQLLQLLTDTGKILKMTVQRPESSISKLASVKSRADKTTGRAVATLAPAAAAPSGAAVEEGFTVFLEVVGPPPSPQALKVRAGRPVTPTRLDYLLSSGVCLAADDLDMEGGEAFQVPIHDAQVLKVWNTPRPDMSSWDHSGPAKLRLTLATGGRESTFTLPIHMQGNRQLIGSQSFRWAQSEI
jgi:hypothetical protein